MSCVICADGSPELAYSSKSTISINSLSQVVQGRTEVYYCERCGHLQTPPLGNLVSYYDSQYKILADSEDEDQLYTTPSGVKLFRTQHQVQVIFDKTKIPIGAEVLDYGCGKSSTLKALTGVRRDINPHVFDVSSDYREFWNAFVPEENQATYETPGGWTEKFDLVTTFFALEHVPEPIGFLKHVHSLLKIGGRLHGVVPNAFGNVADFIVVDHTNHFSSNSLRNALALSGFVDIEIDGSSHDSAWVFTATRAIESSRGFVVTDNSEISRAVLNMSAFWRGIGESISDFEKAHPGQPAAIYGSGFYGTFLMSSLLDSDLIRCFVDQNPYRQGSLHLGRPIYSPKDIPDDVEVVYVGLNPSRARSVIDTLVEWRSRGFDLFYL